MIIIDKIVLIFVTKHLAMAENKLVSEIGSNNELVSETYLGLVKK
jgi:hypothetical protein